MAVRFMIVFAAMMLFPMAAGMPKDAFRFSFSFVGLGGVMASAFFSALEVT